jgi:hypothetical protein
MKATVLVAAACVALAGCTITPRSGPLRTYGASGDYAAYVTVVKGQIQVYPEAIVVERKNVHIYWYLDRELGYEFADDGIVIEDRHGEFTNCKSGARGDKRDGGFTYRCHDKNDKHDDPQNHPRAYKYLIRLQIPGKPGSQISVDPMIVND